MPNDISLNMTMKMKALIHVRTAVVNTAVVEEEVPIKALHGTPLTPVVEEEVPKQALHAANAAISLNMAMKMLAVGPMLRNRSTSDMSWDGTTCRP